MNNQLKAIILASFSLLIVLCAEFAAYLTYPNNTLDEIHKIIEEDKERFWKVRSDFDSIFWEQNVQTDTNGYRIQKNEKVNPTIKIATMGASPSFGWGVGNDQTYTSLLGQLPQVESKNFSQIGYSSFQGLKVLDDVIAWAPNFVFISYIINDLDYLRFFYNNGLPDSLVKTDSNSIIATRKFLNSLYCYKWLKKILSNLPHKSGSLTSSERVSLEDFKKNYLLVIDSLIEKKITPIILKFPVNLPEASQAKSSEIQILLNQKILQRKHEYYKVLEEIALLKDIKIIDLTKVVETSEEYLFLDPNGDTIHPNTLGHRLFFEYITKNYNFEM